MPTPNVSLATLRPEFGVSLEVFNLMMSQQGFIAGKVAPVIDVGVAAGTYGVLKIENLLQQVNLERKARGGYARDQFEFGTDTFNTKEYGYEAPVDDNDAKTYGNYFQAEALAALRARDKVVRGREQRVASLLFNTTTWTGASLTSAVSTAWSNYASSTPIADIAAAKKLFWKNLGLIPNALIFNWNVFTNLQQNADLISRIKYSGLQNPNTDDITEQAMATAFGVKQLMVATGQYNSSNEGQTATLGPIWSDSYAMLAHVAESNDIQEPCIARTFHWGGDGSVPQGAMESYRDETKRGNVMRCRHQVHEKVPVTLAGFLLSNIT